MAGAGTLTFSGTLDGLATGQRTFEVEYEIESAIDVSQQPFLAVGDNDFLVPAGANGVIIEPPMSNAVVIHLKGASGESGIALHRTLATIWMMDISQTTFTLTIASAMAGPTQITFF